MNLGNRKLDLVLAIGVILCAGPATVGAGAYVYPAKGQTPAQQQKDESECAQWAKGQSGVDPAAPAAGPDRGQRAGGALGGAARGAAAGAAVGAIAGDAGKGAAIGAAGGGMVGRRRAIQGEQAQRTVEASSYDRAFAACMDARGYSVK